MTTWLLQSKEAKWERKKKQEEGIPKQYRDAKFQKFQAKWYDKLESSGFDDLEWNQPGGQNSDFLKSPLSRVVKAYNHGTEEFYRRCCIHLSHARFKSVLDKFIFQCYSEGQSYRTIIKSIAKKRNFRKKPYSVFFIHGRVHRLLDEMEAVKLWEDEEIG